VSSTSAEISRFTPTFNLSSNRAPTTPFVSSFPRRRHCETHGKRVRREREISTLAHKPFLLCSRWETLRAPPPPRIIAPLLHSHYCCLGVKFSTASRQDHYLLSKKFHRFIRKRPRLLPVSRVCQNRALQSTGAVSASTLIYTSCRHSPTRGHTHTPQTLQGRSAAHCMFLTMDVVLSQNRRKDHTLCTEPGLHHYTQPLTDLKL
jgi:hypothetical protein